MGFDSLYKLSVILSVIDNMSAPIKGIGNSTKESISKIDKMSAGFDTMTKAGVLMTGAGVQIAEGLQKPIEATFDTKRAIGELSSLGVEKLALLEDAAKDFSNTWAGTTKAEFLTAAYDIKSGISTLSDEGVAKFTELSGITATATKSSIATMTSLFATGYGIYKDFYADLSDEQFGEIFSSGIATSVKLFKTNGDEMASAIQSLGASATNASVPLEEQLAILGMLQATMGGAEAGTKYNAFMRSAVKGAEALGLSFVDANNQMLSMPEILDLLHGKFGDTIDATEKLNLQEAFGDSEAVKLIDLMYNKTGDLQGNIVSLYETMGNGKNATLEMADAINSTDPSSFEILTQKMQNVAETVGNAVTPKMREYGQSFSGVLDNIGSWVSDNEELTSTIFMVLAGLAAFLIAGGITSTIIGTIGGSVTRMIKVAQKGYEVGKFLFGGIRKGIPLIKTFGSSILNFGKTAVSTAAQALAPLIASVWSFTAALLANPITWIVIGIVALIAGIVLLYNKCEAFRNVVNKLGAAMKAGFGAALDVAKKVFGGIADFVKNGMQAAKETVTEKLNNIKDAYVQHGGGIKGVAAAAIEGVKGCFTVGYTFMDKLTGGKLTEIKNKFSEKLAPIKEVTGKILDAASATVTEKLNNMKDAYVQHGGGIKGVAAAAIEGVKGYFTTGFTFIDNLTGGKLTEIKNKFSEKLAPVKEVTGKILDAANTTVTEKLNNMKNAYAQHGGGIKGVAAAAIEGVKGYFTAGYTFIDNLTGGKLTEIKNKFSEKLAPVKEVTGKILNAANTTVTEKLNNMKDAYAQHGGGIKGVAAAAIEGVKGCYTAGYTFIDNLTGGKLNEIKQKFADGINNIKSTITNSIAWFKESGKKVIDTFTNGIKTAINHPVEAVKEGLQKIRNMLPFSDAKTGPLSQLTLSGSKVLSTLSTGIAQTEDLPAVAVEQSFGKMDLSLRQRPRRVNASSAKEENRTSETRGQATSKRTIIEKVILNVDPKTIKDLQQLLKLMSEIEDYTNSRGDDDYDLQTN